MAYTGFDHEEPKFIESYRANDVTGLRLQLASWKPRGETMLHALTHASSQGRVHLLDLLLSNVEDTVMFKQLFFWARFAGRADASIASFEVLLKHGWNLQETGHLVFASCSNDIYSTHWLLDHGADPSKDYFDFSNLQEEMRNQKTPWASGLNGSAQCGNLEVFKLLVERGASVDRNIPLHCVACSAEPVDVKWKAVVDFLVDEVGVDINARDSHLVAYSRGTPLEYALMSSHAVEKAKYLFEKGANPYLNGFKGKPIDQAKKKPAWIELAALFETRIPPEDLYPLVE